MTIKYFRILLVVSFLSSFGGFYDNLFSNEVVNHLIGIADKFTTKIQ